MTTQPPFPAETYTPEPPRKQRGCLFYGCIVAALLVGIVVILVSLTAWSLYRGASQIVEQYAEDAPAPIPVVERPAPEVDAIKGRIDTFSDALADGKAAEPLALSADEINAVIASVPEFKGLFAVDLSGDKLRGKLSLPLDRLGFPIGTLFPGKFLNGTATLDARVVDGRPVVTIDAIEARGKPVPDEFLKSIRGQNLFADIEKDPKMAASIGRLESIAVKDGKLILTPRPPAKPEPPAKPDEPARPAEAKAADPARPPAPADQPGPPREGDPIKSPIPQPKP
jgi:hypothetical protein